MFYSLAVAITGVFVLLGGWLLVQHLHRLSRQEDSEDCDSGDWDCHHCASSDTCAVAKPDSRVPHSGA